jgi:ABC-type oligopeptide transport system substrate-binding subunit
MLRLFFLALILLLTGCNQSVWNDPYPAAESGSNTLYLAFQERPKHLDPAIAYSTDAYEIIGQIVEPPLQYDYLKRPYTLIPLTLRNMPDIQYLDATGKPLANNAPVAAIAQSIYTLHLTPGIFYQPHPAFARDRLGQYTYWPLTASAWRQLNRWQDFTHNGTQELTAADYVYAIKRLASPQTNCPILGIMSDNIVGMKHLAVKLAHDHPHPGVDEFIDLDHYTLRGVRQIDRYTLQIHLYGKYPQFSYWLAMPFFAPIPRAVDAFYHQPGMSAHNFTLDWHPVGTGPYQLTLMNPNWRMVLSRNPNFHHERYPNTGSTDDAAKGLLRDAGKPLPFIDDIVFSLEKETIPYWNKFLQGYYDYSAISTDNFNQAIATGIKGNPHVTPALRNQGITLSTATLPDVSYIAFNMHDSTVGGNSMRARQLRQAISIAVDYEEFITIFLNGRGIPAQSPIPPGIFGYDDTPADINPVTYHLVDGHIERRSITDARRLLAEAGYPNGRDSQTGAPLVLYYDNTFTGPNAKAYVDWMVSQLARLNIQLVSRSSDFNRFEDKIRHGTTQIFVGGWNADYPDPENFLALFYGPNSKLSSGGENDANYHNPAYDALFEQMKNMDNTPQRFAIIQQMVKILQQDAPWMFGYFPRQYVLRQAWIGPTKPMPIANNTIKYIHLNPALREQNRNRWNHPIVWPLLVIAGILLLAGLSMWRIKRRRDERTAS